VARDAAGGVGGVEEARGQPVIAIRLNGWQRLWVVISTLYLVLVAGLVYPGWPTFERTAHRDVFVARMPDEARKHVVASYVSEWSAREDRNGVHHVMPNGAVLVLRSPSFRGVWDEDVQKVVNAYFDVVREATRAARWSFAGYALLTWLIPSAVIYGLGWSVGWVLRGFRDSAKAR